MSLTLTSDDALAKILSFLSATDILRLITTGSARLIARVAQNTTLLDFQSQRAQVFPFWIYRLPFPKLRSLTVHADDQSMACGYLSLGERSLLPLEPMAALQSLDFEFQLCYKIFDRSPERIDLSLSSCFPNLTSLSIRSLSYSLPPLHDWIESLPQHLLSLKLFFEHPMSVFEEILPASSFELLPKSLECLQVGPQVPIGAGPMNLRRFENLRVLWLLNLASWDVLQSLPDSIEQLRVYCPSLTTLGEKTRLPLSKLPPKIRSLDLDGESLELDFDCPAPSTLEALLLEGALSFLSLEQFENFFPTKTLRSLFIGPIQCDLKVLFALIPNLEKYRYSIFSSEAIESLQMLPRKMKSIFLSSRTNSTHVPLSYLPPALESLVLYNISAQDILDLPKGLLSLHVSRIISGGDIPFSSEVWRHLPNRLTYLSLKMCMFESEHCIHVLPETLKVLRLNIAGCTWLSRVSFPKTMQDNLENLSLTLNGAESEDLAGLIATKLKNFSVLSNLRVEGMWTIYSDTLRNLPQSLTLLHIKCEKLSNYGLPEGKTLKQAANWEEGALSRLPEGLLKFSLNINYESSGSNDIDPMVFSRLPRSLASLSLFYSGLAEDPTAFMATLPRRISCLILLDDAASARERATGLGQSDMEEERTCAKVIKDAIDDYFSDPFWAGLKMIN